eukprot:3960506-Ditylum_brightwellii.AAC.1
MHPTLGLMRLQQSKTYDSLAKPRQTTRTLLGTMAKFSQEMLCTKNKKVTQADKTSQITSATWRVNNKNTIHCQRILLLILTQ